MSGFAPCRTVTVVRNHLIEHAYLKHDVELGGQKDVMSSSDGPLIRPSRADDHWPKGLRDRGMLVNARALKKAVHPVLERAWNAMGGYVNDREALMMPQARNNKESEDRQVS